MTSTSKHGVSKREGHDASDYYARELGIDRETPLKDCDPVKPFNMASDMYVSNAATLLKFVNANSVGLVFTSPPYHVGKEYDTDETLDQYLAAMLAVWMECYRVLVPGGRMVINVANLGRRPYVRLNDMTSAAATQCGFLPRGEIIWQKAKGAGGNCAWGSFNSASAPSIRDLHEYLLVFSKQRYSRPDRGESTMTKEEFMEATTSVWNIAPELATRVNHPAPFPVALAHRVINLYSYKNDVVLDPFAGSGTTCVAAKGLGRRWMGIDINLGYVDAARERINRVP